LTSHRHTYLEKAARTRGRRRRRRSSRRRRVCKEECAKRSENTLNNERQFAAERSPFDPQGEDELGSE